MARLVYYDEQCGFVPYDDCPQDNLYSESEAKHTFSPSETPTNADRIRAMTDEELAEWFAGHDAGLVANVLNNDYVEPTKDGWLDWLKQECDENGT